MAKMILFIVVLSFSIVENIFSQSTKSNFSKENLIPWCIVPFDAKQRKPEERAEMLQRLGFKTMAYDWREEHIPQFDEEVEQLKKHGITMSAFWWSGGLPASEDALKSSEIMKTQLDFFKRNKLNLDVWVMFSDKGFENQTDEQKYDMLAKQVDILAQELQAVGCRIGLYNHGGWSGEPKNMVGIIKKVKSPNVGIVYNFHHAHDQLDHLSENFKIMRPYLYCVNLNGMNKNGPKIFPLGAGDEDLKILKTIKYSGYKGPIGIIGHVDNEDVEVVLKRNLKGLKRLLIEIGEEEASNTL